MSSRSVAFSNQETAKVKIYESNLCEGKILNRPWVPLNAGRRFLGLSYQLHFRGGLQYHRLQ